MRILLGVPALVLASPLAHQEPAPRPLTPMPVRVTGDFATISGARELKDGRLLLSDARRAVVVLVDPKTGTTQQIGSAGGAATQYAQPGGFYSGIADTVYLLDRAQARFLVISPSGAIIESRSIKRRGVSGSSSEDRDLQRVDSRGLAYFADRGLRFALLAGSSDSKDSAALVRFDSSRQYYDTITMLRKADKKVTQVDEHMQFSREIHGSPEDGWGMAADGSVAVVRSVPYRVDWYSPSGKLTRGPSVSFEPISFTEAEKQAITAANAKSSPSAGVSGSAQVSAASLGDLFAPTKAPFDPNGVAVSPDGRVWVPRSQRATAATVLYDVFDRRGERVDRVQLPAGNHVIGFGVNAVYAAERDAHGSVSLRKYKLDGRDQ